MKQINYKIKFYSPWHCGSGLSAGADVDALVIKDADGLPFIPGRTLKGLIREAAEDYNNFCEKTDNQLIVKVFGNEEDSEDPSSIQKGVAYFTNAVLPENEKMAIIDNDAQQFLFKEVASTAIGSDGVAKEHSLRKAEVTVPCTLVGSIYDVPDEAETLIDHALRMIKHIGMNRNRGLGRCDIIMTEKGGNV